MASCALLPMDAMQSMCVAADHKVMPLCMLLQAEREYEALALEVLHSKCAIQDVFADSRFLRPEALEVRPRRAGTAVPCLDTPIHAMTTWIKTAYNSCMMCTPHMRDVLCLYHVAIFHTSALHAT